MPTDAERLVQRILLPWVEEMQGPKFAHHDALRQAEEVVAALIEAGYMQPRRSYPSD